MNLGSLPGMYWDEEKQKYFQVRPNHVAPPGAQYARGQVKQQARQSRKRKRESDQNVKRWRESVKPNPVLKHPLAGGISLQREHGINSLRDLSIKRDEAIISQYQPTRIELSYPQCGHCNSIEQLQAQYLPDTNQMLIASSHNFTGVGTVDVIDWDWSQPTHSVPDRPGLAAFHSDRDSMYRGAITAVATHKANDVRRALVCSANQGHPGNVYMGIIPPPTSSSPSRLDPSEGGGGAGGGLDLYFGLGDETFEYLSACSFQPTTGNAAIRGTSGLWIIEPAGRVARFLDAPDSTFAPEVDWLDPNIVAFANNEHRVRSVQLWDTRTKGATATRFRLEDRVTGILAPGGSGFQRYVSTNRRISLFDTRMHRSRPNSTFTQPLLSLPHTHEGPQLQAAISDPATSDGVLAAVDRDGCIQMYSLMSGGKSVGPVGGLKVPSGRMPKSSLVHSIAWGEDERGVPALMASEGNGVVRWSWGRQGRMEEG